MSSKLESMIPSGDKLRFRTRMGWGALLREYAKLLPLTVGFAAFLIWYSGEAWPLLVIPVLLALDLPRLSALYGGEALVTDRRVLHKTGGRRQQVTEIALQDIQVLERVTDYVTLRDSSGQEIHLDCIPDSEGLAEAVVARTGVRSPNPVPRRIRSWDAFGARFTIGCAIASVFLLNLAFDHFGVWDALSADLGDAYLILILCGSLVALYVGGGIGMLLLVLAMRLSLIVEEARVFFNLEDATSGRPQLLAFLIRLEFRFARRFASLLYGERV